ncbi:hypothetical protein CPB85DRAFT_1271723, partial [Mucidula mucida]
YTNASRSQAHVPLSKKDLLAPTEVWRKNASAGSFTPSQIMQEYVFASGSDLII